MEIFWFIVLVVVWMGFLLLEGFDFGVGMLHRVVGRDEEGRSLAIRTIGPVWDGNEVWLIVAIAATFAAFPSWYATALSAFYPVILIVLVALILRGVSFEFRSHTTSDRSRNLWSGALAVGSLVAPLGLGIMLGGFLGGIPIDAQEEFVGGFGDLFRPYAVLTGVTITLVSLLHGAVFLAMRTTEDIRMRALGIAKVLGPVVALVVIAWVALTRFDSGGALLSVIELATAIVVIAAALLVHVEREVAAFVATCATTVGVVVSLFSELYPRVMVSSLGAANDLTVAGTASGPYALGVMTVVLVVLLPIILIYQGWTLHVFRNRVTRADLPEDGGGHGPPPAAPAVVGAERDGGRNGQDLPPGEPENSYRRGFRFAAWVLSWAAALAVALFRGRGGRSGAGRTPRPRPAAQR
ncbi:cytochrome d ubiquinol oxidase subunit II [Pseudonocardia alaniniphila]|uniref:Cytochrome d ubiquinol oxidase subunit II n=1 Tax=Pseudonocardia alaniniphila TaxID=75291 RepID=A0ABS9TN33_9PSEU|nr:cytochrome d ubiquinol oxidase subunit II [Pseudonocardia alaniniphila]MCH6169932.1 cytochrome d ubiquinol oxidase subunit II [Pseudonocardia alaniniphila]